MATVATQMAMASASGSPHEFVSMAMVGSTVPEAGESNLAGLLISGEAPILATSGDSGSALFTSHRVLVAQQTGILTKRLAVSVFRRDQILAYSIDPSEYVTLKLFGSFGSATLMFDGGFDPMQLSSWLGETLVGQIDQKGQ